MVESLDKQKPLMFFQHQANLALELVLHSDDVGCRHQKGPLPYHHLPHFRGQGILEKNIEDASCIQLLKVPIWTKVGYKVNQ